MTEAQQDFKTIRQSINTYYSEKINEFGATARGVDWRDDSSQKLRFEQLIGALGPNQKRLMDETCTILDYGCGYGAFLSFIRERGSQARYFGFDISQAMIDAALVKNAEDTRAFFSTNLPAETCEFSFANGIFNVRLESESSTFHDYALSTIDTLNDKSLLGFSFNMLTAFSDKQFMREDLHYEDPAEILTHCLENYSRTVSISHGYQLYEFTVGVQKDQSAIGPRR